jgi:hypothetical protein
MTTGAADTTTGTGQGSGHGLDATPQIIAADQVGAFAGATPNAGATPGATPGAADPTQGGKTLPIGGADGGQASVFKPEGAFDHLIGQTDQETIAKYHEAYKGARAELSKGKPAIPAAAEYKFEWPEALKGAIAQDDPALAAFTAIAHEHEFTQRQMEAVPKFLAQLVEKGMIDKPMDASALLTDLAPAEFRGTPEEKMARGGERLQSAEAWIRQLAPQHGYDDAMKQELRLLTTSPAGVKVIETLMRSGMNPSVSTGAGAMPGAVTKADIDARVADPRNDAFGPKFDPSFAEQTREMFKKLYG